MVTIHTVGYEGLGLEDFLRQVRGAGIGTVVDVRDMPLSRKRGFSKSTLAAALRAEGLEYLHVRSLGCPKPIRDQYRASRDWDACTAAFMTHLRSQSTAVSELASLCESRAVALLCFEANAEFCHRTYVARAVAAITGGNILHIGAAGTRADRAISAAG
jgi:uncharacterized protein (DUF488 family)